MLRRSTWYRRSHARDQTPLRMRIRELAMTRPRFGYLRIHVMLRREGWAINRKRVHRLYRLEGLQVRMRVRRRKRLSLHRGPVPQPTTANQHWSMDFVHDQLLDGRRFRVLTVIDQWSRESVSVVFHRARPTPRHEAGERCPKGCWLGVACKAVPATRSVSSWCHEPVQ